MNCITYLTLITLETFDSIRKIFFKEIEVDKVIYDTYTHIHRHKED